MKAKINIAIDEGVLQILDRLAKGAKRSRSSVIELAVRKYLGDALQEGSDE